MLPGADLSGYDRFIVLEAEISFRKGWLSDTNSGRGVKKMITTGKELFAKAFSKELKKRGRPIADGPGDNVLLVRPAINNLDVKAPDPNNISSAFATT